MRISKYALSILFLMAASCVAAHAQQAPTNPPADNSDAQQQPQADGPSDTQKTDHIHLDSCIPGQADVIVRHYSHTCVTRRGECHIDEGGEKGSTCICETDDGDFYGKFK
jgi:hypothetical protein